MTSIPNEAVKAAVKAYINTGRPVGLAEIEAILEAAAPHIVREAQAAAWDEGSQARWDWQWRDDAEPLSNPYRSQA